MLNQNEEKKTVLFEGKHYSILEGIKPGNKIVSKNIYLSLNDETINIGSLICDKKNGIEDYLEYNDLAIAFLRNENTNNLKRKCQSVIKILFIPTMYCVHGNEYQMQDIYSMLFSENYLETNKNPKIKTYYL